MSKVSNDVKPWRKICLQIRKGLRIPDLRTRGDVLEISLSMKHMSIFERDAKERNLPGPAHMVMEVFRGALNRNLRNLRNFTLPLHRMTGAEKAELIQRSYSEPIVLHRSEGKDCFVLIDGQVTAHMENILPRDVLAKFSRRATTVNTTPGELFVKVLRRGVSVQRAKLAKGGAS